MDTIIRPSLYRGSLQLFIVPEGANSDSVWLPGGEPEHNDALYSWGVILQRLLRRVTDGKSYHVGGMYVEFDNSGLAVTPPTVNRADDLSYYTGLAAPQDYLRVPISATAEDNSDTNTFAYNNVGVFHALTSGTQGMNGLAFSNAAGSRVYGGALVAFCDPDDASQDIILARAYMSDSSKQLTKLVNAQIGCVWRCAFE